MTDRLTDLHGRVEKSRRALQTLADRAAELRARLATDVAFVGALDRLAAAGAIPTAMSATVLGQGNTQEDGQMISDAWEIALINEEGK